MIWSREMESGCFSVEKHGSRVNLFPLGNLDLVLPGHLFTQEYQDHGRLHDRKHRLTAEQVNLLEKSFQEENKLEAHRKSQLAKKLGLPPRQVAVWFQNRRARSKVKQIEQDYQLLRSSYGSLREKHELVLEENKDLKSKVLTLTEKLQSNGTYPETVTNQNSRNLELDDGKRNRTELQPVNEEHFNWWLWPSTSQPPC